MTFALAVAREGRRPSVGEVRGRRPAHSLASQCAHVVQSALVRYNPDQLFGR